MLTSNNVIKAKLAREDGGYVYEIEIVYNNVEYEFELDAYSGAMLSWEFERNK